MYAIKTTLFSFSKGNAKRLKGLFPPHQDGTKFKTSDLSPFKWKAKETRTNDTSIYLTEDTRWVTGRRVLKVDVQMTNKHMKAPNLSRYHGKGERASRSQAYTHTKIASAPTRDHQLLLRLRLLVGSWHRTTTLENGLPVSYKVKHTLNIQTSNSPPRHSPKRDKSTQRLVHECSQEFYS